MALREEEDESQQQQQLKRTKTSETLENLQWIHIFPSEIEIEILSRLPVESLLRCKSVCTSWCSLISDPHFVKYHLSLSKKDTDYAHHRLIIATGRTSVKWCPFYDVIYDKSIKTLELDYPLKNPQKDVCILGSCNGLLWIYVTDIDDEEQEGGTMFIWNPSTRRSYRLPYSGFKFSLCPLFGFGHDKSSDDYKVVILATDRANTRAMIYSLKSGNWKRIDHFPSGIYFNYYGNFFNGALYWAAWIDSSSLWTIISLDLATETYGEVLQPVYDKGIKQYLRLGVLREWLCLLCDYTEIQKIDVWVMKNYGVKDSWTKLVSIKNPLDGYWWPLTITNDVKILLDYDEKLVMYDVKNGSFSEIINYNGGFAAYITFGSLVSPCPEEVTDSNEDGNHGFNIGEK